MAMVALAYALLLRADQFHVRFDAVLSVSPRNSMLTKQTFRSSLFFRAFLLIRAMLRRDRGDQNLVISGAIVVLIASVWYIPHMDDVIGIYRVNASNAAVEHEAPVFSAFSIAYYWVVLCDLQIQVPFFIFVAGVTYSVRRRFRQDWMLYLWILTLVSRSLQTKTLAIPYHSAAVSLLLFWLANPAYDFERSRQRQSHCGLASAFQCPVAFREEGSSIEYCRSTNFFLQAMFSRVTTSHFQKIGAFRNCPCVVGPAAGTELMGIECIEHFALRQSAC